MPKLAGNHNGRTCRGTEVLKQARTTGRGTGLPHLCTVEKRAQDCGNTELQLTNLRVHNLKRSLLYRYYIKCSLFS